MAGDNNLDFLYSGGDDSALHAVVGTQANPDNAAKALDLEKKTGAPATVIHEDLDGFMEQYKSKSAAEAVQNPAIKGYVNSSPMAAKVSNDDWTKLNQNSKTVNDTLGKGLIDSLLWFYKNNANLPQAAKEGYTQSYGEEPTGLEHILGKDVYKYPGFYSTWQPLAAPLDAAFRAPVGAIGAAAKVFSQMYSNAGGNEAEAARLERDLNIIGTGAMIEPGMVPGASFAKKPVESAKPETFTPEATAALQAGEIPRPGADPKFDELHVSQQKLDSIKMGKLIEESDQSLTKQRSPELYADFVRQHGEAQDISIQAEKLQELYTAEGKTPEQGDGLLGYVPDLADKVRQGLENGTEVKIPFADFVANTDSTLFEKLKDNLRFRDEGVTAEEAKELGKTEAATQTESAVPEKMTGDAKVIAQAAEQQRAAMFLNPLIKDGKTLGIDEVTFKRLSNRIEESQNEIVTRALAAAERQAKKPLTEEWKKNEATTRFQAEEELRKSPDIATDHFLRTGELPNKQRLKFEGKMDAAQVEEILGKDHSIDDLTQAKGGISPDSVADLLGWPSSRDMLKAVEQYNYGRKKQGLSPNAYLKSVIDKTTADRMREKYGLLPENILAEARDIATSDLAGKMLSDEIKMLADSQGFNLALDADQFRDKAKADFNQITLDQIPTETSLRRAIEQGYKKAEKALAGGKFEDALKAMLARRQAFWTLRELKDFQRDQVKLNRDIERIGNDDTVGRIDSAHVMQARKVLDGLGINTGKYPDGMLPFAEFVRQSDGRIAAADWIGLNEGLRTSLDQLTVEEIRDLQKTLQSVLHVGRDVKQFDTAFGQASLEDVVRDTVKELDRFDLIKQPLSGKTVGQRAGGIVRSIGAANILPERILDYIDKFNPNGPLNRWLDRPLREAFAKELKYQEQIVKDIRELKDHTDTSVSSLISNDLIHDPLTNEKLQMDHWNLRKLMLYMGSESGREKALRGFFQGRDTKPLDPMEMDYLSRQVEKLIKENATEKDVKFVNKVFSIHEKLLPDIKQLQLEDTGVPMDTVRKRGYSTPAGDVDGGYIKVRYDKDRSSINEDIRSDQSWFESGYRTITTPHGYTIRRTGYSGFLDLDMTLFASELQSVVHDLAFRSAIRNAGKLINDPTFAMAMRQKWGTEYTDLFPQWLRDIANANTVDDTYAKGFVHLLKNFRQNVVSALVGFNVGTVEKHGISALGMSVKEVGAKDLFSNMAKMAFSDAKDLVSEAVKSNPELADFYKSLTTEKGMSELKFALNSSPILRNRVRKYNETVYGAYDEATASGLWGQAKNIRQLSMYFGRMPISIVDGMSTFPEWLSAYKREMGVSGDHGTAVYAADKAVSRSHGSAFIGDAPAILRQKNTMGGELMRWVTPLYKFWNHNFNMLAGQKWDVGAKLTGRDEPGANWRNITNTLFWVTVIPIIAEEISAPALDTHKGSSLLQAIGRYFGGQLPFVRDISNAVLHGYEPSVGMLGTVAHQMTLAAHEVGKQGDKAISRLLTGFAMLTGIGSQPLANKIQYDVNIARGKESPHNTLDILQGMRTGSQKPRRY